MGEGDRLMAEAEKKRKGGIMSWLSGGTDKDEICRIYERAGNAYKLDKEWLRSGECFILSGEMRSSMQEEHMASNMFLEGGMMFERGKPGSGSEWYRRAVRGWSAEGKYGRAAKVLRDMAERAEREASRIGEGDGGGGDLSGALGLYIEALELYDLDQYGKGAYSQCALKVGDLLGMEGRYREAIRYFEREATKQMESPMTAWGAKDIFLKCIMLRLSEPDAIDAKVANSKYASIDPQWTTCRQGRFANEITQDVINGDIKAFTIHTQQFDNISPLDKWKTHFLFIIKSNLETDNDTSNPDLLQESTNLPPRDDQHDDLC